MTKTSNLTGINASLNASRKDFILSVILPWLILAASLAFTFQMWLQAQHDAAQALQIDFNYRVRDAIDDVSNRMKTYEQVMRGVDGLFAHSNFIEPKEFHGYISRLRLEENYPGIQGIRFVPIVQDAMKGRHIAAMRNEGLPSYNIWPKSQRDIYAPVAYSEPLGIRDQQVIGYDMLSDYDYPIPGDPSKGIRRATMERARDSGSITISGRLRLLYKSEDENQNDFVMFLPVYRFGASSATTAERRANIIGWVCSVFNADDLMRGILGNRDAEIDIEIFDGDETSVRSMIFDSQPSSPHQHSRFNATRHIRVADRTWTLAVHSLPGFENKLDVEKPRIIAATGILISLSLASFIWLLVFGRKRALQASRTIRQEMAERQQAEQSLREAESRFRYIFDYSKVGIHLAGPDYRYVRINRAFCEMTGYSEEELLALDFKKITHPDSVEPNVAFAKKLIAGELDYFNLQKKYICKNGSILHGDLTVSAVRDKNGKLLYVIAMIQNITDRIHIEQQLRDLTAYLQSVREDEKALIAREIHDDLGGMLTSLNIEIYWLKNALSVNNRNKSMLLDHVREMSKLIDCATSVMRNIITGLRPTILDDLGLLAALEWQAKQFQKLTGIKSRVNCIGDKGDLDKARSIELFRISQEALSNVAKHSGATCVEIEYHHGDEEIVMSVIDNGRGMSEAHTDTSKHYGMLGMRERTDQLGGMISTDTPPGGGFSLTVILPLPPQK